MKPKEKQFILYSCALSLLQGLFYILAGLKNGFNISVYIMAVLDLLYIPAVLIFRSKGLKGYILVMTCALVFLAAFTQTKLYNNFSGLLCLFMAIMIWPQHKRGFIIFYIIITSAAFCLNDEPAYYIIIHTTRALWLTVINNIIIQRKYNRKPVILTEEEKELIKQLTENKQEKELELKGYSLSTIRRRLDAAKKRNDCDSLEELKELYNRTTPAED